MLAVGEIEIHKWLEVPTRLLFKDVVAVTEKLLALSNLMGKAQYKIAAQPLLHLVLYTYLWHLCASITTQYEPFVSTYNGSTFHKLVALN